MFAKVTAFQFLILFKGGMLMHFVDGQLFSCDRHSDCSDSVGQFSICVKDDGEKDQGHCICDTGSFASGPLCLPILKSNCTICARYVSESWQCSGEGECECNATHYLDLETGIPSCTAKATNIFDPCNDDEHCSAIPDTLCKFTSEHTGICVCDPSTHYLVSDTLLCGPLPEHVDDSCEFDEDCAGVTNSECVESEKAWGTCKCKSGFEENDESDGCRVIQSTTGVTNEGTTYFETTEEIQTDKTIEVNTIQTTTDVTNEGTTYFETATEEIQTDTTIEVNTIQTTAEKTPIETTTEKSPIETTTEDIPIETTTEENLIKKTTEENTIETTTEENPNETTKDITQTTPTTTSTTEPAKPPAPGTQECVGIDQFGNTWRAFIGHTATQICPGRNSGQVSWFCQLSGNFLGNQPNYMGCSTEWVDALSSAIEDSINNGTLDFQTSKTFFNGIFQMIDDAFQSSVLDPDGNGENQFFGHEVQTVLNLAAQMSSVLCNDKGTDVSDFEQVIGMALNVSGKLMRFQKPMQQLSPADRTQTFSNIIDFNERNAFNLARKVSRDSNQDGYSMSFGGTQNSGFSLTVGIANDGDTPSFPSKSEKKVGKDSFMTLPPNWRDSLKSNSSSFVASGIDASIAAQNFQGKLFDNEVVDDRRQLNSKMMSFSIGENEHVEFINSTIEIVFQLEQTAYGSKPMKFRRRLHEGEKPSSVGATPKCSYFNKTLQVLSTNGCKLVSDGPYSATCVCNHLSSFGLLSQSHEYPGKSLSLQITSLAAPGLPIVMASRQLYSSPPLLVNWRQEFQKLLMIFFVFTNIAFTILIDKYYFRLTDGICYTIGLICHFIFIIGAMFLLVVTLDVFICSEGKGLLVFRKMVKPRSKILYGVLGIVVPMLIVGITVLVEFLTGQNSRAYGGEFCWLDGYYIWAFYGPAILIFTINSMLILCYKLISTGSSEDDWKTLSTNFKFSLLLLLSWWVAFYQIGPNLADSEFLDFCFPLINGAQGLALYLFSRDPSESVLTSVANVMSNPEIGNINQEGADDDGIFKSGLPITAENNNSMSGGVPETIMNNFPSQESNLSGANQRLAVNTNQ